MYRPHLAAIEHFGLAASQCPVLVITADTIFHPDYNFRRILEHSHVRGTDVVATYELTPGQVGCNCACTHNVSGQTVSRGRYTMVKQRE